MENYTVKKVGGERSVLTTETKSRIEDIILQNYAYTLKEIKAKIENERSGFRAAATIFIMV